MYCFVCISPDCRSLTPLLSRLPLCRIVLCKTAFFFNSLPLTCCCSYLSEWGSNLSRKTRPKAHMQQETWYVCSRSKTRQAFFKIALSQYKLNIYTYVVVLAMSKACFKPHMQAVFILVPILTGYRAHTAHMSRETLISRGEGVSTLSVLLLKECCTQRKKMHCKLIYIIFAIWALKKQWSELLSH